MKMVGTSIMSAADAAIRIASLLVIVKIVAVTSGPEGIATFGQIQGLLAIATVLCSGAFPVGLVVYTAREHLSAANKMTRTRQAVGLAIALSAAACIPLFLAAGEVTELLLLPRSFRWIIAILGAALLPISLHTIVVALLNGTGRIADFLKVKVAASLLLLVLGVVLTLHNGGEGAALALVLSPFLSILFSGVILKQAGFLERQWITPALNIDAARTYLPFWLMSLSSAAAAPVSYLLCRTLVGQELGWSTAGAWDASVRIGETFLLVVSSALAVYYVPKLSQCTTRMEENKLVRQVLLFALSFSIPTSVFIFYYSEYFLTILFSKNFTASQEMLKIQLIASLLRVVAWIYSYHMIVRQNVLVFLLAEISFGATLYAATAYFVEQAGLVGAGWAFVLSSALYLAICTLYYYSTKSKNSFAP